MHSYTLPPGIFVKCVCIIFLLAHLIVRDTEGDDIAFQRNSKELQKELILLLLSRQTYHGHRASVLSNPEDICVQSLLMLYVVICGVNIYTIMQ